METSGAVATPSLLRMPDFGKAVTNLEGNIRKTIHTAKKTITSARKSFSCVSFPEEDGNRPQTLSTEIPGAPDSAENDQLSGVGGPDSGSEEGSNMLPNNLATLDLLEKARRLANGVEMKDRHYRLKLYTCCFVGEEAVEWMMKEGMVENVEAGVELGNSMREHGLLRHVTDEHPFENKDYFYRFTDFDATGEGSVCSNRSGGQQLGLFRGVNSDGDWTLGTEVVRLQRRVSELSSQLKLHRSLNLALFESASEHQQRMEAQGQANADLAGAMERTVALQTLFIGFLMLTAMNGVMGFVLKVVGAVVLWQGAKWTMKAWLSEEDSGCGTVTEYSALLDKLRDSCTTDGSTPEVRAPLKRWFSLKGHTDKNNSANSTSSASLTNNKTGAALPDSPISSAPPKPEDYVGWEDRPCLLRLNMSLGYQRALNGLNGLAIRVNTGEPFFFETRLFKGCAVLWVAGLESSPPGLFQGRKRKTHLVVQGQFKEPVSFNDLLTGQEFRKPLKHLPAKALFSVLLRFGKKLSPSMLVGLDPNPHLLAPVAAGAQAIHIAKPGKEPALDDVTEDIRSLGPQFASNGEPLTGSQRKRLLSDQKQRANLNYDTEHVWTFHFWQHLLDLSTFELDMNIKSFSLSRHLNSQPLQLMAKTRSGEHLWNFEMWHESLLGDKSLVGGDY